MQYREYTNSTPLIYLWVARVNLVPLFKPTLLLVVIGN
jgi:hypothetical protein